MQSGSSVAPASAVWIRYLRPTGVKTNRPVRAPGSVTSRLLFSSIPRIDLYEGTGTIATRRSPVRAASGPACLVAPAAALWPESAAAAEELGPVAGGADCSEA